MRLYPPQYIELDQLSSGPVWELAGAGVVTVQFESPNWGLAVITLKRSNDPERARWYDLEDRTTISADLQTPRIDVRGFAYLKAEVTTVHGSAGKLARAVCCSADTMSPASDPVTLRVLTGSFVDNETPGGAVNDVNTAFTLASAPSPASSLQLYLNGQLLLAGGVDYTLAGSNITMIIAPFTGDRLRAWYRT